MTYHEKTEKIGEDGCEFVREELVWLTRAAPARYEFRRDQHVSSPKARRVGLKLDVGCGNRPQGDVNVDLYVSEDFHRAVSGRICTEKIPNFVNADGLHLPFRNKAFEKVVSNYIIEHINNPFLFLKELIRVAERIELNVPFGCINDWIWWRVHGHKWYLFPNWYRKQGLKVKSGFILKRTLIRGKEIPLFRYPYLVLQVTNEK